MIRKSEICLRKVPCGFAACAAIVFLFLSGGTTRAADCGNGVTLRLSAPETGQGSLLLATVRSAKRLSEVTGKWNELDVSFWEDPLLKGMEKRQTAVAGDVWRGLLGVDLEKPAGKYEFTVSAPIRSGETVSCAVSVEVKEGHFATESLTVKKQFAEPDPEQLARAQAESKRLREIYEHVTPEQLWKGKFRLPLDGDFKGSNFGRRRVLNGKPGSPHSGVDFPAPTGTPVHAAQSGRVVLAEELYYAGNAVIVDHGLGIYTLYCHFSEIDAKVGDMVSAGTVLGKVGATGRVTGPHLHWGLTVERAHVNALDIVKLLGSK
jgi:murein DD-endopeptidase MepM/ murein hydrolase activator NlpD